MNEIRKGKVIIFEGGPCLIADAQFLRKQQRRPVMRTIMKDLRSGRTREHTFHQSDMVEEAGIEQKPVQFLYKNERFIFMDTETFEQLELEPEFVGDQAGYLIDGQTATVVLFEGKPLAVDLPIKVERKVIEAAPGVRGDTSTNVMKEITVEGGLKVRAPLFIKEGESIRIDTRNGSYVERV